MAANLAHAYPGAMPSRITRLPVGGSGWESTRPLKRTVSPRNEAFSVDAARTLTRRSGAFVEPYAMRTVRDGRLLANVYENVPSRRT
jgi:hypothetical protein